MNCVSWRLLFSQAGKPVSRDAIMTKLWESDSFVDDNTLTVNITRLRKKLEGGRPVDFIITRKRSWIHGVRCNLKALPPYEGLLSSIISRLSEQNISTNLLCFYPAAGRQE